MQNLVIQNDSADHAIKSVSTQLDAPKSVKNSLPTRILHGAAGPAIRLEPGTYTVEVTFEGADAPQRRTVTIANRDVTEKYTG